MDKVKARQQAAANGPIAKEGQKAPSEAAGAGSGVPTEQIDTSGVCVCASVLVLGYLQSRLTPQVCVCV